MQCLSLVQFQMQNLRIVLLQLVLMQYSLGGTQTDLNGLTSVDVDNITIDGNTISTTNTNGNIILDTKWNWNS